MDLFMIKHVAKENIQLLVDQSNKENLQQLHNNKEKHSPREGISGDKSNNK